MIPTRPALIVAISILFVAILSSPGIADTMSIGSLSKVYKPLKFTHDKHMDIASKCDVCHHYSGEGKTPTCVTCHSAPPGKGKIKTVTGLKDAYHNRCIGCHKEMSGPVECAGCHSEKKKEMHVMYLKTISNLYGPAVFTHGRHIDTVGDCASCHHQMEGSKVSRCKECHEAAPVYKYKGQERKTDLGLKGAYHGLCVGCHKESSGPVGCVECHKKQVKKG